MTIFGFTLWGQTERDRIRAGQSRIGDVLNGIADDLEEVRKRNRLAMGLSPAVKMIESPRKKKK